MSIQENNKMIAEFMGLIKYNEQHDGMYCAETMELGDFPILFQDNQYNTSWDWLMPVIRKINEVSKYDDYCKDRLHLQRMLDECINENTIGRLEVYNAVVEFINQYNNNESTD